MRDSNWWASLAVEAGSNAVCIVLGGLVAGGFFFALSLRVPCLTMRGFLLIIPLGLALVAGMSHGRCPDQAIAAAATQAPAAATVFWKIDGVADVIMQADQT